MEQIIFVQVKHIISQNIREYLLELCNKLGWVVKLWNDILGKGMTCCAGATYKGVIYRLIKHTRGVTYCRESLLGLVTY